MTAVSGPRWGMSVGMAVAIHAALLALVTGVRFSPSLQLPPPVKAIRVELGPVPTPRSAPGGRMAQASAAPESAKPMAKPTAPVPQPVARQVAPPPRLAPAPAVTPQPAVAATSEPVPPLPAAAPISAPEPTSTGADHGTGKSAASGPGDQGGGVLKVDAAMLANKNNAAYVQTLFSWLEKYRQYPRRARLTNTEGTVLLRFRIDRQGNLLAWSVVKGSGSALLDKAVEDMITAANPLPAVPADFAGGNGTQPVEFVVPIDFRLLS
jgi:protein TonB